jgi:hypothetical protein
MAIALNFFHSHPLLYLFGLFLGGIGLWHIWDLRIRPLFIPRAQINALVDTLIARHGPDAECVAWSMLPKSCTTFRTNNMLRILTAINLSAIGLVQVQVDLWRGVACLVLL